MSKPDDYERLMEELGRIRPSHGKFKLFTKKGVYEVDTNFFPARIRKIEPKEQEDTK